MYVFSGHDYLRAYRRLQSPHKHMYLTTHIYIDLCG